MVLSLILKGFLILGFSANFAFADIDENSETQESLNSYIKKIQEFSQPRLFSEWVKMSTVTLGSCGFVVSFDSMRHLLAAAPLSSSINPYFERWLGIDAQERFGDIGGYLAPIFRDLGLLLSGIQTEFIEFKEYFEEQIEISLMLYGENGACRRSLNKLYAVGDEVASRDR